MIRLITYGADNMKIGAEKCCLSAMKWGVDDASAFISLNYDDLFKEMNKEVLTSERGKGYWLWKPCMIMNEMLDLSEGDILIYSDAGVEFIGDVRHIINAMDEDIFFFSNGWTHVEWCKMDVIQTINPRLVPNCLTSYSLCKQVQASVIFFRVNQKTKDFVKEWLLYCQMPGLIDDSPSITKNYPTFAEHRHDQAILTCLQIKYGYKQHWWACDIWQPERHRWPEDKYPAIFHHHRKRDNQW